MRNQNPQTNPGGYRFLEHTSDAYIEAWGSTIEEAFTHGAEAFYETMINPRQVTPKTRDRIIVEGHDEKELLYNWLEALLLRFDINDMVYSQFKIKPISQRSKPPRLEAEIRGEKYQPQKHGAKVEIKGMTYHMMEIERTPAGITIRFVIDL